MDLIGSRKSLIEYFRSEECGVRRIKPRVFFRTLEETLGIPTKLSLQIPSSEIGSITMLEAAILCAILRLAQPRFVVEIGTYLGYSTRLFLDNTEGDCAVVSVDLPSSFRIDPIASTYSDDVLHSDDQKNDEYLRLRQRTVGAPYLSGIDPRDEDRLQLIKADSRSLGVSDFGGSVSPDFVFIDGGHDEDTVSSDSKLASNLIGDSGIIIWHDFESTIHQDVTTEVQAIASSRKILAVTNTLLAIELRGTARRVFTDIE